MKLRELGNLIASSQLKVSPLHGNLPVKKQNVALIVSNDSSTMEKELLESIASARLAKSPLHLAIFSYERNMELAKERLQGTRDLPNNSTGSELGEVILEAS